MRRSLCALALATATLAAGCTPRWSGKTKLVASDALPEHPEVRLALAPVEDRRPEVERSGRSVLPHTFLWLGLFAYVSTVGNEVTAVSAGSLSLDKALLRSVGSAKVATLVRPEERPDFTLRVELEHAYATQNVDSYFFAVIAAPTGAQEKSTVPLATVGLRLFLTRSPTGPAVWEERVSASASAIDAALAQALALTTTRVSVALETLSPSKAAAEDDASARTFVVESVTTDRTTLVRLLIDRATRRAVKVERSPLVDPGRARPGEWLLARSTAEGRYLSDRAYLTLARSLASRFDLRIGADARRIRFLGVL